MTSKLEPEQFYDCNNVISCTQFCSHVNLNLFLFTMQAPNNIGSIDRSCLVWQRGFRLSRIQVVLIHPELQQVCGGRPSSKVWPNIFFQVQYILLILRAYFFTRKNCILVEMPKIIDFNTKMYHNLLCKN